MTSPMVFMICGSTGAGKSTYSKKLISEFNAIYFSIDEWMKTLFWMDAPNPPSFEWTIDKISRCEALIWSQTQEAINVGHHVVLDLGFSETNQRSKFYQLLNNSSISYQLHFLDVSREDRWERVQKRNNELDKTSIQVIKETFDWMEDYFQAPSEEELKQNHGMKV